MEGACSHGLHGTAAADEKAIPAVWNSTESDDSAMAADENDAELVSSAGSASTAGNRVALTAEDGTAPVTGLAPKTNPRTNKTAYILRFFKPQANFHANVGEKSACCH